MLKRIDFEYYLNFYFNVRKKIEIFKLKINVTVWIRS